MSEKRRGLGRGIGALIPPATQAPPPDGPWGRQRPVDVFFPQGPGGRPVPVSRETVDENGNALPADNMPGDTAADADTAPTLNAQASNELPSDHETAGDGTVDIAHDTGTELVDVPGAQFAEIPVTQIRANSRQPRQVFEQDAMSELVHSVREIGVLQPVVVRPLLEPDADGARYELIMGERRWRASTQAGLTTVPAIIRATDDDVMLRDALLENLHRAELNPLEEAAAYQQLLEDFGCTQDELSRRIGRSRPQISNTIRLLKLPPAVQRRVAAGVLSAGHARALLALEDPSEAEKLAHRVVTEGLSVRAVEEIVASRGPRPTRQPAPRAGRHLPLLDDVASRLSDRLDTRVKVALGKTRGRLTVEFASVDDLDRILAVMDPGGPGVTRAGPSEGPTGLPTASERSEPSDPAWAVQPATPVVLDRDV
ncbi:ParB/RepB/Spo0J family partition protein [Aquipuribacter sp. MA13-6]|uniref:ParB/RepB/Spo0J family partition protein n=1 Tax=unclassified Aquipuribacter TaxID=2635084 RepID=UPI003EEE1D80